MKCSYDNNIILSYIDGQLCDSEKQEFEKHLKSCDNCSKKFKVLIYAEDFFKQEIEMKKSLSDNVLSHIDKNKYRKNSIITKASLVLYKYRTALNITLSLTVAMFFAIFIFQHNSSIVKIKNNIIASINQTYKNMNDNILTMPLETPTQLATSTIHTPIPSTIEKSKQNNELHQTVLNMSNFLPMEDCIIKSDFIVEEIPIEEFGYYQYLVNGIYDINCDEKEDQISCILNHNEKSILKVNDTSISFESENPFRNSVNILDFDKNDNYKEILIYDDGPSGDPRYDCFRYNGKEIISLGRIYTSLLMESEGRFLMDGQGKIITNRKDFITPNILSWAEIKDNQIKYYPLDISFVTNKSYEITYDFEAYFIESNNLNDFQMSWESEYIQKFKKGDNLILKDIKINEKSFEPIWYFVELQNQKTGFLYFFTGD